MNREISEKELTPHNTLVNAGPRRNSSNARSSASRRQSHTSNMDVDESSPRLKWDEANLYLAEQERGATMKIDEPKTPYVKQYDPTEDEDEIAAINAQELMVDELDKAKSQKSESSRGRRQDPIPNLDLGEPEEPVARTDSAEKRVVVETNGEEDGMISEHGHGEAPPASMSEEARRKHREFEEKRKRHYEIPAGALLGADGLEDDIDDDAEGARERSRKGKG